MTATVDFVNRQSNRPFPHYAPVSKHKEMKTRLGWTISYKSLYFVHPSLELVPLFTGMRERSISNHFRKTAVLKKVGFDNFSGRYLCLNFPSRLL